MEGENVHEPLFGPIVRISCAVSLSLTLPPWSWKLYITSTLMLPGDRLVHLRLNVLPNCMVTGPLGETQSFVASEHVVKCNKRILWRFKCMAHKWHLPRENSGNKPRIWIEK